MSWALLTGALSTLALAVLSFVLRREGRSELKRLLHWRERVRSVGADRAPLRHPTIDLDKCMGCGACVRACPEDEVLAMLHGQASLVRGAGCVGTGACARECPTGAIRLGLSDVEARTDIPAIDETLEAVRRPGLFLAGEVTAQALVKTAVDHGTAVARRAAQAARGRTARSGVLDLVIVGAGPAGLAAALEARRQGLDFAVLEREAGLGGTVARYPRAKLVLTQPIELPLVGRLGRHSYSKEELMELWGKAASDHHLPITCGVEFQGAEQAADGTWTVRTSRGEWKAWQICLALGRRGAPNRLGVPGEELPKVAYGLLDAESHRGKRILVVGGGDSAVETALALAEQPGNRVTLSYRQGALLRAKAKNQRRFEQALEAGRIEARLGTRVRSIGADHVLLGPVEVDEGAADSTSDRIANDLVFIQAGGEAPKALLERCGVSFDPADRALAADQETQRRGLTLGLSVALGGALAALCFALWHGDYYFLDRAGRATHLDHGRLRPGQGWGLWFGLAAALALALNLAYLLRRRQWWKVRFASLRTWMDVHVATGLLALPLVLLHGGMEVRGTLGGQALWVLVALVVTGVIGRYLYARVPRAAGGRELELAESRERVARWTAGFERVDPRLAQEIREQVAHLVEQRRWGASLPTRLIALVASEWSLLRFLRALHGRARASGMAQDQLAELGRLARGVHRAALVSSHYEDLRALASGWRWLHRWGALLLILLTAFHVAYAWIYGSVRLTVGAL